MSQPEDKQYATWARSMVDRQLRSRGVRDPLVLEAMAQVPRHRFIPAVDPYEAYSDRALPTSGGQTISQPYMVAMMTELLNISDGKSVLEIGAGSGYQAAVLAHIGARVISIERNAGLAKSAQRMLDELGYGDRVQIIEADGTLGWSDGTPYDGIIVTAGAPHLPKAYQEQLAEGGRIVIPIGDNEEQRIVMFERHGNRLKKYPNIACKFVPLLGKDGWRC